MRTEFYSLIHAWTLPTFNCWEWSCCEYGCTNISSISCFQFFWVNTQKWDCWTFYELTLLRICHPVAHSGCTFTSPLVVYEVSGFFSSLPTLVIYSLLLFFLLLFFNLIVAILKSVRWHLIVLLSFISPQMCSLVICVFPLENVYLNSLSDLESGCLFLLFCWKSVKCVKWERLEELPLFPRMAGYGDSRGAVCCH